MGLCSEVCCRCLQRLSKKPRLRLWKQRGSLWRYRAYNLVNAFIDILSFLTSLVFVVTAKFKRCSDLSLVSEEFCGYFISHECSNSSYTIMLGIPMMQSGLYSLRAVLRIVWIHLTGDIQHRVQLTLIEDTDLRKKIRRVMRIPSSMSYLLMLELSIFGSHAMIIGLDKCRDRLTDAGIILVKKCRWYHLYCVQGFANAPTWILNKDVAGDYYMRNHGDAIEEPDRSWSYCNEKEYLYTMAQWWDSPENFEDDPTDPYSYLFTNEYDAWSTSSFACPEDDETTFIDPIIPKTCAAPCVLEERLSFDPARQRFDLWSQKFIDQEGRISYYRLVHQCYLFGLVYFMITRLGVFAFVARQTVPDALYARVPLVDESTGQWIYRHFSPFGWNAQGYK